MQRIGALGRSGIGEITKAVIGIGAVGWKPNQFEGCLSNCKLSCFFFFKLALS